MSLSLSGVTHGYAGGRIVLRNVDLAIEPGETVAIRGPSGSGKTTLLSIMGGLLRPSIGQASIDGVPLNAEAPPAGTIGWIFQTINLLPYRSALDNVAVGLLAIGMRRRDTIAQAQQALERVGLAGYENRLVKDLSGGEAQRVGVARALASRPPFVLADEPTGQLDRSTSLQVIDAMFAARPNETAIAAATHDDQVAARCSRQFEIVDGRVLEIT